MISFLQPEGSRAGCFVLAALLTIGSLAPWSHASPVSIRVSPATTHQTMDGFGASGAWWAQNIGGWPEDKVDRIVDLLYGPAGAAMTIYRYNIGAGGEDEIHDPWRRTESFETGAGQYDWSRDAHAVRVLRKVRERGVEQFVFFANSPPLRLTKTGMASGGEEGGNNLKEGAEDDFAQYLVDIAEYWRRELNLPHVTLSPVNEPQWRWGGDGRGQEGCHYSPEEAVGMLRAAAGEIAARKAPLHLEGPEAARWGHETLQYFDAVLDDPVLRTGLHRLAIHSYFSGPKEKEATMAHLTKRDRHPPVAMTEWCEMRKKRDVTMGSALTMAREMHEDLTIGNSVSWQAWIAISRYDYKDGLIYVDRKTREITPAKRLWVMGQFSRFVREGYVRIGAEAADEDVLVTAFLSPKKDHAVMVAVNPETNAREVTVNWEGRGWKPALRDIHVTTAAKDLTPMAHEGGPLRLEPESVTTFRFSL